MINFGHPAVLNYLSEVTHGRDRLPAGRCQLNTRMLAYTLAGPSCARMTEGDDGEATIRRT